MNESLHKKLEESRKTSIYRSSHRRCSIKKGFLRNFSKFIGKHLCGPEPCNFIKKETLAQVFSCEFCEISKNTFFTEHLRATTSFSFITQINLKATFHLSFSLSLRYHGFSWSLAKKTWNVKTIDRTENLLYWSLKLI